MKAFIPVAKATETAEDDLSKLRRLMPRLREKAAAEDAGHDSIAGSLAMLGDTGILSDDGTAEPDRTARMLMHLGGANLSLGRLVEGHVNALYLARAHGSADVQRQMRSRLAQGAFFGVWGADDATPVTLDAEAGCLHGGKKFASGLGVVTHAVLAVDSGTDVRLALIDVTNPARQDPGRWQMPGMKATVSGAFDCEGLPVSSFCWIGEPGDYYSEPHFIAGVWRIAALQVGATLGLLDLASARLRAQGRMGAEAQKTRLGQITQRAVAGFALVEKAARWAGQAEAQDAVAMSISARLVTEDIALDAIKTVEQCLGMAHFVAGSDTERMARDLSVYLRQAARDAMLSRFADHVFADEDALWRLAE